MINYGNLPIEIINKIINYTNIVVYRYGKYMDRINKNDDRYNIIKKRRLPILFGKNKWIFCFTTLYDGKNNRGFTMEHYKNPLNNLHYLCKKEFIKHDLGTFEIKNTTNYVFDKEGNCRQIINYIQ